MSFYTVFFLLANDSNKPQRVITKEKMYSNCIGVIEIKGGLTNEDLSNCCYTRRWDW